ncbi:hypothetical protein [Caenispirillum bisanense]|uniref:hypothetical protein n=1 Tax=Caenispirillum bisanense TaxID=414052 RepID=UPI0031D48D6C
MKRPPSELTDGEQHDAAHGHDQNKNNGKPDMTSEPPRPEEQDGKEEGAHPDGPVASPLPHIRHFSNSLTCLVLSALGGPFTLMAFAVTYPPIFVIIRAFEVKHPKDMATADLDFRDLRLTRWPLAMTGFALALASLFGTLNVVAPVTAFVFCALACGVTDARTWSHIRARKSAGGER